MTDNKTLPTVQVYEPEQMHATIAFVAAATNTVGFDYPTLINALLKEALQSALDDRAKFVLGDRTRYCRHGLQIDLTVEFEGDTVKQAWAAVLPDLRALPMGLIQTLLQQYHAQAGAQNVFAGGLRAPAPWPPMAQAFPQGMFTAGPRTSGFAGAAAPIGFMTAEADQALREMVVTLGMIVTCADVPHRRSTVLIDPTEVPDGIWEKIAAVKRLFRDLQFRHHVPLPLIVQTLVNSGVATVNADDVVASDLHKQFVICTVKGAIDCYAAEVDRVEVEQRAHLHTAIELLRAYATQTSKPLAPDVDVALSNPTAVDCGGEYGVSLLESVCDGLILAIGPSGDADTLRKVHGDLLRLPFVGNVQLTHLVQDGRPWWSLSTTLSGSKQRLTLNADTIHIRTSGKALTVIHDVAAPGKADALLWNLFNVWKRLDHVKQQPFFIPGQPGEAAPETHAIVTTTRRFLADAAACLSVREPEQIAEALQRALFHEYSNVEVVDGRLRITLPAGQYFDVAFS